MNLQLTGAMLARGGLGLSDVRQFALQCRDAATDQPKEAAALILLAEKAMSFFERHEGIAMTNEALHAFVERLAEDAERLRQAASSGDTAFLAALNAFCVDFSADVVI
ncbi:hypothetical protein P3T18_004228 [Paraburkholderia sp. GAS199]|uniref:hypothetical protein n=1 Tax=Paraburkholderia sp. GAS199 TaxID=3035126 RepID=UPI003D1F0101